MSTDIHQDDFLSNLDFFRSDQILHNQKNIYETKYEALDKALGGGFTPGLISLGAVSSLGKSTFALQLAHNIALGKKHVLFFSLEMKRDDIIAKALTRELHKDNPNSSITVQDLMNAGSKLTPDGFASLDKIISIMQGYEDYHLSIIEPDLFSRDVGSIEEQIDSYIAAHGNDVKPFVIIDYLQILSPKKGWERCTDKQIVDDNLYSLKNYADEHDLPILLISSFNRDSYDKKASLQSFKDSGNIEYTSDVLMALQYAGAGQHGYDVDLEKQKSPRNVELIILKQRYGPSGQTFSLPFYPEYNLFDIKSDIKVKEANPKLIDGRLPEARRHF